MAASGIAQVLTESPGGFTARVIWSSDPSVWPTDYQVQFDFPPAPPVVVGDTITFNADPADPKYILNYILGISADYVLVRRFVVHSRSNFNPNDRFEYLIDANVQHNGTLLPPDVEGIQSEQRIVGAVIRGDENPAGGMWYFTLQTILDADPNNNHVRQTDLSIGWMKYWDNLPPTLRVRSAEAFWQHINAHFGQVVTTGISKVIAIQLYKTSF